MLFLLNGVCLAEKQQIQNSIWPDPTGAPIHDLTTLEASMLAITGAPIYDLPHSRQAC